MRSARIGRAGVRRARSDSRRAAEPWSGATGPVSRTVPGLVSGLASGTASLGCAELSGAARPTAGDPPVGVPPVLVDVVRSAR
ncbi:hypothetical protein GCM10009627_16810 [Curtobacterium herbarum]|uniref:Uncharacterized protein n=1 Tax=Curtobacterium herbarum TaxID=150122 RepID=A0ABN1ZCM7_9MICO